MIIPDVNLLVYAYNADAPHHEPARSWWEEVMTGGEPVGMPWAVAFGFVRIVTHPRVLATRASRTRRSKKRTSQMRHSEGRTCHVLTLSSLDLFVPTCATHS